MAYSKKIATNEELLHKWMEAFKRGRGVKWVAAELEMNASTVANRATSMRRKGVRVPQLRVEVKTMNAVDIARLNAIVDGTKEK